MIITMPEAKHTIKGLLSNRKMSIFAGAGISVPSGLPTWGGFVDKYIEICQQLNEAITDPRLKFDSIIADAHKCKTSDLISVVSALKSKVIECKENGINTDWVDSRLNKMFAQANPNDFHKSIVSTDYKYIITTNYDSLLEDAAENLGYKQLLVRSYSYTEHKNLSMAVYSGETAIIHAHGKMEYVKLDQFVLTNEDYLSIMKHNPGFRLIINSVFLTTSVLFAGYGANDPHFEDIISDLNATLEWDNEGTGLPRCYILLKKDEVSPIKEYLSDKRRVDIIPFDSFDEEAEFLKELSIEHPRARK